MLKYLSIFFVTVITAVLLIFILLPSLASTNFGKKQLLYFANQILDGEASADSLSLSWLSGQKIEGVRFKDKTNKQTVSLQSLSTDTSLLQLLFKRALAGKTHIKQLEASLFIDSTDEPIALQVKNVNADIAFTTLDQPFALQMTGETHQAGKAGRFSVEASSDALSKINNPLEADSENLFKTAESANIKVKANAVNLPSALVDQIIGLRDPKWKGSAHALLGDQIDLKLEQSAADSKLLLHLTAISPQLNADFTGNLTPNGFQLSKPGQIDLKINSDSFAFLSELFGFHGIISLKSPTDVHLVFTDALIPFDLNSAEPFALNASVSVGDTQLASLLFGDIAIRQWKASIDSPVDSPKALFKAQGEIEQKGQKSRIDLNTKIDKPASIQQLADLLLKRAVVDMKVKQIPVSLIDRAVDGDGKLANFLGSNANADLLIDLNDGLPTVQVNFESERLKMPNLAIRFHELNENRLAGLLTLDAITTPAATLQDLKIPFTIDLQDKRSEFELDGTARLKDKQGEGKLTGNLAVSNWHEKEMLELKAKAILRQVPVAILGDEQWTKLLGNSIDLHLDTRFQSKNKTPGYAQIALKGQDLSLDGSFQIENGNLILSPSTSAKGHYILTQERLASIHSLFSSSAGNLAFFDLKIPSRLTLDINALNYPLSHSIEHAAIDAVIRLDQLQLQDKKTKQQLIFKNFAASIQSQEVGKGMQIELAGQEVSGMQSPLKIIAHIENLLDPKNLSLALNGKLDAFPAGLFCGAVCLNPDLSQKINALFGDKINATVNANLKNMTGGIRAEIQGRNGTVKLNGQVNQGFLSLNEPFTAQFTVTEEMSQAVLRGILPPLGDALSSDSPLMLSVDPRGFSFPLAPFDKTQIEIGKASLELGHVNFRNDGQLASILSLLKVESRGQLSIWFTPLYVSMSNGRLKINRMDLLLMNSYPAALWGAIDFPKDRVNMILGIAGPSLMNAFRFTGLADDYMMQIPFRGTLANASIDKTAATAKISALIAQMQGSSEGQLIGALLEIAGGTLVEERAPPPTTNPLPWANEMKRADEVKPAKEKRKKNGNPVKEIEKGATDLLDAIFR